MDDGYSSEPMYPNLWYSAWRSSDDGSFGGVPLDSFDLEFQTLSMIDLDEAQKELPIWLEDQAEPCFHPFPRLPREIQDRIYQEYLFEDGQTLIPILTLEPTAFAAHVGEFEELSPLGRLWPLMQVSKAVMHNALDVFFLKAEFIFNMEPTMRPHLNLEQPVNWGHFTFKVHDLPVFNMRVVFPIEIRNKHCPSCIALSSLLFNIQVKGTGEDRKVESKPAFLVFVTDALLGKRFRRFNGLPITSIVAMPFDKTDVRNQCWFLQSETQSALHGDVSSAASRLEISITHEMAACFVSRWLSWDDLMEVLEFWRCHFVLNPAAFGLQGQRLCGRH